MRSRWNDEDAKGLADLDLLVYASRLVGAESSLVVWGGGNTSIKLTERDHRAREIPVLRVKGSGSDLKSIQRKDFPGVKMDDILALLDRADMGDQEMVSYLAHGLVEPGGPRPSIETLLHGFLPAHAVVHTHADAIVSLTNNDRAAETLASVYGGDVIALAYRRPGFRISKDVADAIAAQPQAKALVLERHGTITWGATVREAYEATIELISRAEEAIAARRAGRRVFGAPRVAVLDAESRRATAVAVAPRLRGQLGRGRRVVLAFDDDPRVAEFASSAAAPDVSQVGPATPDHTIFTKRVACLADVADDPTALAQAIERSVARYAEDYTRYFEAHRFAGAELLDPLPRVVLVPGLGMFTAGKDRRTAAIVERHLPPHDRRHGQRPRLRRLRVAHPARRLRRRVLAARAVQADPGAARARAGPPHRPGDGRGRRPRQGHRPPPGRRGGPRGGRRPRRRRGAQGGRGDRGHGGQRARARALRMDVTSEASVREAFEETVLAYGGLDVLVSNAGIAHSTPVAQLALADWERSFAVNSTGHFLVAREAMRILMAQGLGGALVFVATKNVMSPGKDFAAYSAAKAAEAQLAKVLALEGAPHGIRSNIVNPDAVFQDSGLWSPDVRRERAAAQGIAVEQLEEFYRKRNLLGARILPDDVAEAVLFLASDRSAKTTGCTLTVDGGVKDAFPR